MDGNILKVCDRSNQLLLQLLEHMPNIRIDIIRIHCHCPEDALEVVRDVVVNASLALHQQLQSRPEPNAQRNRVRVGFAGQYSGKSLVVG